MFTISSNGPNRAEVRHESRVPKCEGDLAGKSELSVAESSNMGLNLMCVVPWGGSGESEHTSAFNDGRKSVYAESKVSAGDPMVVHLTSNKGKFKHARLRNAEAAPDFETLNVDGGEPE